MDDFDPQAVGKRIRERREALGLVQEDLAHAARVRGLAISELERGRTADPRSSTLSAIAGRLGVTIDWLLHGDQPTEGRVVPEDEFAPPQVLLDFFATDAGKATSEAERQALIDVTRRMGPPKGPDAILSLLGMLRLGFAPAAVASAEEDMQKRRTAHAASGRRVASAAGLIAEQKKKRGR